MIKGRTSPRKIGLRTEAMKKYKITNIMLAKWFSYTDVRSFNSSKGKKDMIYGISKLIEYLEEVKNT